MKTWLDEYTVGDTLRSPYFKLHREEILAYSRFTHDLRPVLFATPEDAQRGVMIPPLYLLSLGMCLLQQAPERDYLPEKLIAFLGFETVEFGEPASIGDAIYASATVDEIDMTGKRGRLWYRHEVRNSDDQVLVRNRHGMFVGRKADES